MGRALILALLPISGAPMDTVRSLLTLTQHRGSAPSVQFLAELARTLTLARPLSWPARAMWAPRPRRALAYSCRSASIGSSLAARRAGK